LEHSEKDK